MANNTINPTEVLIIGAGVVGLATAIALARQGRRVCVVDATHSTEKPMTAWDTRIYALTPASQDWLQAIGVWQAIDKQRVNPVDAMALFAASTQDALQLRADDAHLTHLAYIIENQNLINALLQQVAALDIAVMHHSVCQALSWHDTAIELTLQTGQAIRASLLIAADGAHSFVRQTLNIATKAKAFDQTAVVANFIAEHSHGNVARQWFAPHETLALLPLPENQVSIVWSLPDALADGQLTTDAQVLAEQVMLKSQRLLGKLTPTGAIATYALQQVTAARLIASRVVLVGDAAHQIHPMAGQGLNLGLRDVLALTELLADAHALQDIGENTFLRQYERARKADMLRMNSLTTGLDAWFSSESATIHTLTRWGMHQLDKQAALKQFLIKQAVA